jgi:hypothetical protein
MSAEIIQLKRFAIGEFVLVYSSDGEQVLCVGKIEKIMPTHIDAGNPILEVSSAGARFLIRSSRVRKAVP